jgi:predicted anti-sigma-YlaC factor YlaD
MTSDACRDLRAALGAVALGNADPAEELALRAHLDGCAECRAELRELRSVATILSRADIDRVTQSPTQPADELATRVLGRVAAERNSRRRRTRRRVAVAAATATAIAAAIIALLLIVPGNSPGGTRVVFPTTAGVSATATLRSHTAGTEVAFHVSGLHPGEYYWLWVTGSDGDRIGAGTFQGTGARATDLVLTAALPVADARRIWVTDDHNKVVLDERLPAPA